VRAPATANEDRAQQVLRKQAGLGDDLALAAVDARVAELEARQSDLREKRAQALNSLALLLGRRADETVRPTETLAQLAGAATLRATEPVGTHPSIARLDAIGRGVRAQSVALGRQGLPALDVFGLVAWQYPKSFFETDASGVVYALGAAFSWDVFDGGMRSKQQRELEEKAAEIGALKRAADEDLVRRRADARSTLRASHGALRAARRALEAAEVYARIARTAAGAGTGTQLDVRRADDGVDRARLALLSAQYDAAMALGALWHAEGRAALQTTGLGEAKR